MKPRAHRERSQPKARRRLGHLEKHKDYVLRARDFHQKQAHLKLLREKAANRNADEFYFKMLKMENRGKKGKLTRVAGAASTPDELRLARTVDFKTLQLHEKREELAIARLEAQLDIGASAGRGVHLAFDDEGRGRKMAAKTVDATSLPGTLKSREKRERGLEQRRERLATIRRVMASLALQKALLSKGPRVKIEPAQEGGPSFRWKYKRKG